MTAHRTLRAQSTTTDDDDNDNGFFALFFAHAHVSLCSQPTRRPLRVFASATPARRSLPARATDPPPISAPYSDRLYLAWLVHPSNTQAPTHLLLAVFRFVVIVLALPSSGVRRLFQYRPPSCQPSARPLSCRWDLLDPERRLDVLPIPFHGADVSRLVESRHAWHHARRLRVVCRVP